MFNSYVRIERILNSYEWIFRPISMNIFRRWRDLFDSEWKYTLSTIQSGRVYFVWVKGHSTSSDSAVTLSFEQHSSFESRLTMSFKQNCLTTMFPLYFSFKLLSKFTKLRSEYSQRFRNYGINNVRDIKPPLRTDPAEVWHDNDTVNIAGGVKPKG